MSSVSGAKPAFLWAGLGDADDALDLYAIARRLIFTFEGYVNYFYHYRSGSPEVANTPGSRVVLTNGGTNPPKVNVLVLTPIQAAVVTDVQDHLLVDNELVATQVRLHRIVLNDEGNGELGHYARRLRAPSILKVDLLESFRRSVVDRCCVFLEGPKKIGLKGWSMVWT